MNCPQCGAPLEQNAVKCKYCGEPVSITPSAPVQPEYPQTIVYREAPPVPQTSEYANDGVDPSWPIKNKVAAGVLAIFLGTFGIHKFSLGKPGLGVLYLLFCWTHIPSILGVIEGILYLCSNDHNFQVKHHVRLQ